MQAVFQKAGDVVEADAAQAHGGFGFAAGGGDDDDGVIAIEHGADPGGVLAAQADVDAADEVGAGEFCRVAGVENLRVFLLQIQNLFEGERDHLVGEGVVERGPILAVQHGVVIEVCGRIRLVGGDDGDERVAGHGLEGVIIFALLAERGDRFFAEGFAAQGPGPWAG